MASAKLIQLGKQIASLHRCRIKDAPGRGGSPPLRRGQATVKRFPDHGGDRGTALPRECANPLVALVVDENLQPVRQHAHTLACACHCRRQRVAEEAGQIVDVQYISKSEIADASRR